MEDEVTSINAIYGDGSLTPSKSDARALVLTLPSVSISLLLSFPALYPDEPFAITGPDSVGAELRKGAAKDVVDTARSIIEQSFVPGEPFIFELVEQLSTKLEDLSLHNTLAPTVETDDENEDPGRHLQEQNLLTGIDPHWIISEPIVEKKSIFIARAASVRMPDEAKSFVQHLLATDKKAAKATHNITAWRMKQDDGVVYQDCDDDGETAAGGRLLHLLQLMDVWNVMVVVTRWYGGVHLGPDRFRIVNSVARDAIVKGGFDKRVA